MPLRGQYRTHRRGGIRSHVSIDVVQLSSSELALLLDDEDVEFVKFLKALYAMIGFDPEANHTTGS